MGGTTVPSLHTISTWAGTIGQNYVSRLDVRPGCTWPQRSARVSKKRCFSLGQVTMLVEWVDSHVVRIES